jgi:hypothetical protein
MSTHISDPLAERQASVIVCRAISVTETEVLEGSNIDDAAAAGERLYRRLRARNASLTAEDIAFAVRATRLRAEIWIDAVAAHLDRRPSRRPRRRRRLLQDLMLQAGVI